MSTVILQVGQCGNQVGSAFWAAVNKDKANNKGHVYTHQDGHLRSINVDSEPKVLQKLISNQDLRIRACNIQRGRRGRGTNWALGYYGTKNTEEDQLLEATLESIRQEIERCSSFTGVLMIHSIAGGTGSGLGSRLCETLRDEFRLYQLVNCVVMPHTSGESPLQHYNSLLCLAALQRNSDAIIWFHNDEILKRLQNKSRKNPDSGISYTSMNEHIARCISGLVLPTDTLTPPSGCSIGQETVELVRCLTPLPACKYIQVNSSNNSKKLSWEAHCGSLTQEQKWYNTNGEHNCRSISNLVVARGDSTGSFSAQWQAIEKKMRIGYSCVNWNPFPIEYWTAQSNPLDVSSTATIASNNISITHHLTAIYDRARAKYNAKAYLHWYEKFGCKQSDFDEAFETIEDIITNYSDMTR